MSSIFISLPKTVKNIMSGKLGILYKLLVPLQFVILCSHDASKVISSRIHPCVKRYLPESIHVRKVNYQNTFMCQILFTRTHPCVKSYLPESIHVSNSPNPGVCLLRCSQVFGSLQCRDVVAPELNKWCRSKSLSFHYYHRVRCSYNRSIQRSYPTYPHISMVIWNILRCDLKHSKMRSETF